MSDARDKAIAAMDVAYHDFLNDPPPHPTNALMHGALLDAIPGDVLVAYAIERGALVETGGAYRQADGTPVWLADPNDLGSFADGRTPLYRLATEDDR